MHPAEPSAGCLFFCPTEGFDKAEITVYYNLIHNYIRIFLMIPFGYWRGNVSSRLDDTKLANEKEGPRYERMKKDEAEYYLSVIESVNYDKNAFTVWYGDDKVILGAIMHDNPQAQRFFDYATIYQTIMDLDWKIKTSLKMAIDSAEVISFEEWKPISPTI